MRISAAALLALSFFGLAADNINFDDVVPPSMPPGWTATATRDVRSPHWEVIREPSAPSRPNVFAQTSTAPGPNEFPLAIFDRVICRDFDLSVKFRITSRGRIRTAGRVWRYQDEKNYYLLHFSVDQKNIVLFRVENDIDQLERIQKAFRPEETCIFVNCSRRAGDLPDDLANNIDHFATFH